MAARPLIGITTERNEKGEYHIPGEYVDAVRRAGASLSCSLPVSLSSWLCSAESMG